MKTKSHFENEIYLEQLSQFPFWSFWHKCLLNHVSRGQPVLEGVIGMHRPVRVEQVTPADVEPRDSIHVLRGQVKVPDPKTRVGEIS